MALRIMNNVQAVFAARQLSQTNLKLNSSLEKLSSGYRINKAADDAAGLAISEKLRVQINGLDQAKRNVMDGISLIQTAEGGLAELHSILQRMRVLSVQASNGTLTTSDRALIQQEVTQLLCEIDRMSSTVEYNGISLMNGSTASVSLHLGANQNQTLSVALSTMSTTGLSLNQLSGGGTFAVTSSANAESVIALLDTAINSVSSSRARLGAIQNRLEHTHNFLGISRENQIASESRIRDVDFASEMIEFTKNQILMQAGNAMLAQANLKPQMVLQLFG